MGTSQAFTNPTRGFLCVLRASVVNSPKRSAAPPEQLIDPRFLFESERSPLYNDIGPINSTIAFMYDDTCRFLAEHFSSDFARWLLGEPVILTELQPSELSLEPIRADAMILLQSEAVILHIEFQTLPQKTIPFRMLDYRVRGHRRYPNKTMRQVVIYLKSTTSERAYQTRFTLENTHHEFQVMRLWEQPASLFLQSPGLLPFAALGQSENPAEMLRQATQVMDQMTDLTTQANLMAASAILAGLRLKEDIIYTLVRRDIMQESVIYQSIQQEAEARAEGRKQREIALNLFREGLSIETIARVTGLSIEEVQALQQQVNKSIH